ncbi:hypothetical protein ACS0TY_004480 [Phlomoides rotata]
MGVKRLEKTKQKNKKGLWSPDEDFKLRNHILNYGHGCWSSRNGKSCRLRWINYLRPGLKRGPFSLEEETTILTLHQLLGNKTVAGFAVPLSSPLQGCQIMHVPRFISRQAKGHLAQVKGLTFGYFSL